MQTLILIYHYTGASKILGIYEIIRLLVASYLFLTGFGHATFFLKKGDFSLRRFASVLIRINLLSCILPYIMKTDYLFYYFSPLTSFWFVVIYFTMRVGHARNNSLIFLTAKIITSAALVNSLIRTPGIFDILFHGLEKCCNIRWDTHEWQFRLQLDGYIAMVGALCGAVSVHITDILKQDGVQDSRFNDLMRSSFLRLRSLALVFALTIPPIFYLVARAAPSKIIYNSYVPFFSAFPILSFVLLRNFSLRARNVHSSIFAWMGRHSLETFTLQFHIWLAADTKGLLSTGMLEHLGGRRAEFILLTIIFLWVCWHVAASTQTITSWIIDPKEGREEFEFDADTKNGTEMLPTTKSFSAFGDVTLHGEKSVLGSVHNEASRNMSGVKAWFADDLRARLATIILLMWVLNWVSRLSEVS